MKLKTNKACDLSSISVFPPQSRRLSAVPSGAQASQHRSQPSQQSFSQGPSSQNDMFSQLSQTSLDEALTTDQRFNSQERENPIKKASCFLPIGQTREESQMLVSRSSTGLIRNWNSAPFQDHRGWINEELERRIGMMETSLNKIGMILDSVQSDIMQVNKGTKEVSLEMEGMRQKLIILDSSLQLMKKGQEDVKLGLDGNLKSLSEQLIRDAYQDKLQQIFLVLSALPEQIEASTLKLQSELQTTFTKEMGEMACSLKASTQVSPSIIVLSPEVTDCCAAPQRKRELSENSVPNMKHGENQKNGYLYYGKMHVEIHLMDKSSPAMPAQDCGQATVAPKVDMRGWNCLKLKKSVKFEQDTITRKEMHKEQKPKLVSSVRQERECHVTIESDDDIDGGFSCLTEEKKTGIRSCMMDDIKNEAHQILRKARRKRKHCNPIIIN